MVRFPFGEAQGSVVFSSFPDRVDVDNSQVILASDGKTRYRVILTTVTKFYDDVREYNSYFIEMLPRAEYGDQDTTDLLKGLELVCRFRAMFLEPRSDFFGESVRLTDPHKLPELLVMSTASMRLLPNGLSARSRSSGQRTGGGLGHRGNNGCRARNTDEPLIRKGRTRRS